MAAGCTLTIRAAGCTLTAGTAGRGLVGAAGCTVKVGAAGRGLVGAGGVLGLHQGRMLSNRVSSFSRWLITHYFGGNRTLKLGNSDFETTSKQGLSYKGGCYMAQ